MECVQALFDECWCACIGGHDPHEPGAASLPGRLQLLALRMV